MILNKRCDKRNCFTWTYWLIESLDPDIEYTGHTCKEHVGRLMDDAVHNLSLNDFKITRYVETDGD